MKNKMLLAILSVCILAVFACAFIPASANNTDNTGSIEVDGTVNARFLNMLNRNYVYNSDFESADVITENSILALLDKRDSRDDSYISEAVVKGFINDMYGIEIVDIAQGEQIKKDGFVYIVPRGFTDYSHKIKSVSQNEDGSYTVCSYVTIKPHDDSEFVTTAQTLFVKNEKSAFGYNIIYSNLSGVCDGI